MAIASCAVLAIGGCRELSAGVDYHGVRQLAEGDHDLESLGLVYAPPAVLALRRDTDAAAPTLRLIALDGSGACEMATGTRFLVAFDPTDPTPRAPWRVALLDDDTGSLRFFGPGCRPHGAPIAQVVDMRRVGHRVLLQTRAGGALTVDPFDFSTRPLDADLDAAKVRILAYRDPDQRTVRAAAWLLLGDQLSLVDADGQPLGPAFAGVVDYELHGSPDFLPTGLLAYEDADGVALREVHPGMPVTGPDGLPGRLRWRQRDACEPDFAELGGTIEFPPGCGGAGCPDVEPAAVFGSRLWVAMFAPCDDRTLVLRRAYDDEQLVIARDVVDYRVLRDPYAQQPVVVYAQPDPLGAAAYYLWTEGAATRLGAVPDLQSLSWHGAPPELAGVTAEPAPRYGTWDSEGVFHAVLRHVAAGPSTDVLLHDFDGGRGTLALCDAALCTTLADSVAPGHYRAYDTVERIGPAHRVVAFIDADADAASGRLVAMDLQDGFRSELDRGVSEFVPLERGAVRGILYSVTDGQRSGLWFAPR